MANTYSLDTVLESTRNQVRLLILDTNTSVGLFAFHDEEIDVFLALNEGDVYLAAGAACRAMATDKAKTAIAASLLGDEVDLKSVSDRYLRLAQEFERKAGSEPTFVVTQFGDDDIEHVDGLTARDAFDFEENAS